MTAEFDLSADDWKAFIDYHHFHSPTARRTYRRGWFVPAVGLLIVCLGIWVLASQESGAPGTTLLNLWPLFVSVPFYLVYFPWAYRRKVRKIVHGMIGEGRNRTTLGRQRITISPEQIAKSGEFDQSTVQRPGIERVVKDRDYAYIYVNAMAAFIIPRRAFTDSVSFDEFVIKAQGYLERPRG
jgi:hypothetical protein